MTSAASAGRLVSPLRYPGGKSRLVPYVQDLLHRNGLRPGLFVEPFAGGASVTIGVLEHDLADRVALVDKDNLLGAFWTVVFSEDAEWLADQCLSIEVSVEMWEQMRADNPTSLRCRALKCLYLNRTSFSGILHRRAGPIGGYSQDITKIGCRFPREELARRILRLAAERKRVAFVRNESYARTFAAMRQTTLAKQNGSRLFWYLDPPFFHKSEYLYTHAFNMRDHEALAKRLHDLPGNWLLSYDDALESRRLYENHNGRQFVEMVYSSRRSDHAEADGRLYSGREILVSNLKIPGAEAASRHSRRMRLIVLDGAGTSSDIRVTTPAGSHGVWKPSSVRPQQRTLSSTLSATSSGR
jgi:DNA adenine methylase